ncbi:hypothetical protein SH449x_001310 [Pirellulaceae bacterium SH449]
MTRATPVRSRLGGRITCGDNWDTENRIGGAIRDIVADRSVGQFPESNETFANS